MAKALELVEQVANDFKLTDAKQTHPRQRQAYVTAQVQEQQLIINRLLVDIAKTRKGLENAKDDASREAWQKKLNDFGSDLRQLIETLDFFLELRDQLDEKYKNAEDVPVRPDGF